MKIHQPGQGISSERSSGAARTDRLDAGAQQNTTTRTSQVGLDRIEVSNVAETAARMMGTTGRQREQRIASLSQQVQTGAYPIDMKKLTAAILDHDLEPTPAYGG